MKIVFRVDASIEMGIGHVMRCLTLADALCREGAECHFICREHPGNLARKISDGGHYIHVLPFEQGVVSAQDASLPVHAHWLRSDWQIDAQQTVDCIGAQGADWLVVDHYALDERWERRMRSRCRSIMVIDDLADRKHDCDLLLDQNLGRKEEDYVRLVSPKCQMLIGPKYALLRPEFAQFREKMARERRGAQLGHLLITMGGVDKDNATGQILEALNHCPLQVGCQISVVMGGLAPWLDEVKKQADLMRWPTEVVVNVNDMAQRMVAADLAIAAAGSTSWERCCLGLPTLMVVLADNQSEIGDALNEKGAASLVGRPAAPDFKTNFVKTLTTVLNEENRLLKMSLAAAEVTDGRGCSLVVDRIRKL